MKHLGHYVFPDPGLLVTPASDEKKAKFLEAWLRAREALLIRATNEASIAMSGQSWRDFLATDLSTTSEKKDTKAAQRRKKILDMLTPRSGLFPDVKTRSTTGEPITWQGKKYVPGVLPADHIIREILWELYQLNFYYELLSLDRRACTDLTTSDNLQLVQRQALISECFPVDPFMTTSLPTRNCGLAGHNVEERLPFILALVRVMQSWKGSKPSVFQLVERPFREISASHATELEEAATKYYCQQFFNYFGRAALVPHRLFPTDINISRFM